MTYRFFMPKTNFSRSEPLFLVDEEYHHARHVLRIEENETVDILNGEGACAKAKVCSIDKRQIQLTVEDIIYKARPHYQIGLILAILRPGHLDFALEKCTELGVDHFVLYQAERSDRKEIGLQSRKRYDHLIAAAMKQSGHFFLPSLITTPNLKTALAHMDQPCLYCTLEEKAPYIDTQLQSLSPRSICIVIGPESGFSDNEKSLLKQFSSPVLLHENTLRAETAAICASFIASLWRKSVE